MDESRVWQVVLAVVALGLVAVLAYQVGAFGLPWAENHVDGVVAVTDAESGATTCIVVDVADTRPERIAGLSERESLVNGTGMWFVHGEEERVTYVMREMDFALDIVFVGADGHVTGVHSLPAPGPGEDGENITASGRAKWVLEVPRGYAAANDVDAGDRVDVTYGTRDRSSCTARSSGSVDAPSSRDAPVRAGTVR